LQSYKSRTLTLQSYKPSVYDFCTLTRKIAIQRIKCSD
jgi:hypothetical protein